jgi:hypothetical protein
MAVPHRRSLRGRWRTWCRSVTGRTGPVRARPGSPQNTRVVRSSEERTPPDNAALDQLLLHAATRRTSVGSTEGR